jgi:hypothetical protein
MRDMPRHGDGLGLRRERIPGLKAALADASDFVALPPKNCLDVAGAWYGALPGTWRPT